MMANFNNICLERFNKYKTVLCVGMDPIIDKIPLKDKSDIEKTIVDFYSSIIDNFHKKIFCIKPNIAFYEQYGIAGFKALGTIIDYAHKFELPVILDAKRGDIGNTSQAYAIAAFNELKADAITLSPYLGEDSLLPFFEYKEKGFFILTRTSNKGSSDFQLLKIDNGNYFFYEVGSRISIWNSKYSENIGAVVGATQSEFNEISYFFYQNGAVPLLIPGVGSQGGDFNTIINALIKMNYPMHKIFINSSSKINYAHLEHKDIDYLDAISIEIDKMQYIFD